MTIAGGTKNLLNLWKANFYVDNFVLPVNDVINIQVALDRKKSSPPRNVKSTDLDLGFGSAD